MTVAKPPIDGDPAGVRALVDEADQGEEEAGHDAVRDHLVDGAVPAVGVSVAAPSITTPMWLTDE
jgi:hypothetical protein